MNSVLKTQVVSFSGINQDYFAKRRSLLFFVIFNLVSTLQVVVAAEPPNAPPTRHILVLNSYHQGFLWTDDTTEAVRSTLSAQISNVEFHIEYLDSKRLYNEALIEVIRQTFLLKYSRIQIDAVISTDDNALHFMHRFHDEIFPGVPVVFCGVNNVQDALRLPKRFFTGIVETLDIHPNIEWVKTALPKVRKIVVVSDGTLTGRGTRGVVEDAALDFPEMTFVYLNGEDLSTDQMLDALRGLDDKSVVLAPAWYRDKDGRYYDNTQIYPLMSAASPVPIVGLSAANMGLGIVGGKVNSGKTQGSYAAHIVAQILEREARTEDLPVQTQSQNTHMFDHRQLVRFSIDESLLPPNSQILYRPFSFYKTYKNLVFAVAAVFLLFVAMIALLLSNLHRLRRSRLYSARREAYFRFILDSIHDAVVSTDVNGHVTQMNAVATALSGKSTADSLGKQLPDVFHLKDADSYETVTDPVRKILTNIDVLPTSNSAMMIVKDGRKVRLLCSGAAIKNDLGHVIGTVLVFRDITEEHMMEEQLRQSQKMDAVGQLAGGIAHDFNNMLGGIIGAAELAENEIGRSSPAIEFIRMIISAAENAAGLTQKLLSFSRKGGTVFSEIDIHRSISDALVILERSLDKRIEIHRDLSAPVSTIQGDAAQIQNAVINLGINAGQAMKNGGTLKISTATLVLDATDCRGRIPEIIPGEYVEITVEDTGEGIPTDIIPRIFEPFFTTKEVGKGTGLGLAAVFGTIKDHRGCISTLSEIGIGSRFQILLPTVRSNDATLIDSAENVVFGTGQILVVDDEPVVRATVSRMLTSLGYTVLEARDGLDALKVFHENHTQFDLVLLDMMMPRMGGRECFFELRKRYPLVKVLILSGFSKQDDLDEIVAAGAVGFLKKPYRRNTLATAIHNALNLET